MSSTFKAQGSLLIVVIVALILVGGYIFVSSSKKTTDKRDSLQADQPAASPFATPQPVDRPQAAPSVDCTKEKTETAQDACWQSKAIEEKNHVFCDLIKAKGANTFVSKDACINFVAQAKSDISLCSLIENQDMKKNCEDVIKNNKYTSTAGIGSSESDAASNIIINKR